MQESPQPPNDHKRAKKQARSSSRQKGAATTRVGDISGGKGIAIGANARSIIIEIGSLFDLNVLQTLLKQHWLFIIINIALQAMAIASWRYYVDRYLIPVWVLIGGMILLEIGLAGIYLLAGRPGQRLIFSILGVTSLLGLAGLTGMEYDRAVHPPQFDVENFGVALAQFGEGPEFQSTAQAREVSQLVLEQLRQQAQENPDLRFIQFKSIGLVRNEAEAREEAQKIRADLVIWGRLQISDEATSLNFAILETPDKVSNPTFPRVIPSIGSAATGTLEIPGHNSEEVAGGTTTLAAFTFGLAHYFNWDFAPSARAFQEALRTAPPKADSYLYLLHLYYGLSLQWPGQLQAADEQFKLAARLMPQDPAALLAMAFGNRSLGNLEEARMQAQTAFDLITQQIKLHPENGIAFYNRALASEILEAWDSALSDFRAAVEKEPSLYVARIGVISALLQLKQAAQAIEASQEAIELAEASGANPAWAYLYLAQSYERNDDPDHAGPAYQKAVMLGPQVDWFHFRAGQFYSNNEELEMAEREYRSMIEVTSNKAWGYATLGEFYAKHDRLTEAITAYRAGLQIDPTVGGLWIALADIYEQLGQIEEVRSAYMRAVKEEPGNSFARSKYGYFLYTQGDFEAAILQWEAARQINPQQCDILFNLGAAYENLGESEQARGFYTQILELGVSAEPECLSEARRRLEEGVP